MIHGSGYLHWQTLIKDCRAISVLAIPLILTQLAHVALTTTDIVMLGTLGAREIAAGGLAIAIFNQFRTLGVGLVTATSNLIATANSRGDEALVRQLVRASLLLATIAATAFAIPMLLIERPLLWLGQDPQIAALTARWLGITAAAMFPCLWFQSLRHFTVGMKQPGPLLAITLISVALTATLDYALINGRFGLPRLGFFGVPCTASLVMLLSCGMLTALVMHKPGLARLLAFDLWRARAVDLKRVWTMGIPIAATYGLEAGFFSVIALLVGTLGSDALAAQTIANQAVYIVFMISVGISHASSINISDACARSDYRGARRLGHAGLLIGIAGMAVIACVYLTIPQHLVALFMGSDGASYAGAQTAAIGLLSLAALLQVFDCAQNLGVGVLRGIGDVRSPLRFSLIGYWLVGLPCAYAIGIFGGGGINGIWVGLMLGLATTALLEWQVFERHLARRINQSLAADTSG